MSWLLVALGSAIGGVARYGLDHGVSALAGRAFPWGIVVVNVLGCAAMGAVARALPTEGPHAHWRLLLATGVLGGFTTFSAFSLQTLDLVRAERWAAAGAYVAASVACCLAGVAVGWVAMRPSS